MGFKLVSLKAKRIAKERYADLERDFNDLYNPNGESR